MWPLGADQMLATLIWGALATGAMTVVMEGAQLLGFSRISLPFLFGTFVTGRRDRALAVGFCLYSLGGLLFAFGYALAFAVIGFASWWLGGALGLLHGLFLVSVFLPLLPFLHPRMATPYQGPVARRQIEPPGPFGLNYGRRTPLITVVAQTAFGAILGASVPV